MTREGQSVFSEQRTIALRLSSEQVHQIIDVLNQAQTEAEDRQLKHLQALQRAVVEASNDSTKRVKCAVCGQWFTAESGRRPARYCSASCKQKAYRKRLTQSEHA
jgi:hypothetical protein